MRVAVALAATPFHPSPDRARAEALCAALRAAGAEAELVGVPFAPNPPLGVPAQLLACRLLDLSESMGAVIDRLVGLSLPASAIPHPHKVLWHGRAASLPSGPDRPGGGEACAVMEQAARQAAAESRQVFVTSRFAAGPFAQDVLQVDTLYEPSPLAPFCRQAATEDYIGADGCAAGPRRALLLAALRRIARPVRIIAAATQWPEDAAARAEQAAPGRLSLVSCQAEQLARLVAAARGVLVAAAESDNTGTALAAMQCARPLIVPDDAGAPLELVMHGQTGLVCQATPAGLADALDALWSDRHNARNLGRGGRQQYEQLSPTWDMVARCLLASG